MPVSLSEIKPRNKHGTPIDPVPFLVVVLLGFTICFSYGPPYLTTLGFSITESLVISGGVVVGIGGIAYHRYVWTARPDLRAEIPAATRIQRLFYAVIAGVALLALLALPLLLR